MRPPAPVSELVGQLAAAGMSKVLAGDEKPLLALLPPSVAPTPEVQRAVGDLTGADPAEAPIKTAAAFSAWLRSRVKRWAVKQAAGIEFRAPVPTD